MNTILLVCAKATLLGFTYPLTTVDNLVIAAADGKCQQLYKTCPKEIEKKSKLRYWVTCKGSRGEVYEVFRP